MEFNVSFRKRRTRHCIKRSIARNSRRITFNRQNKRFSYNFFHPIDIRRINWFEKLIRYLKYVHFVIFTIHFRLDELFGIKSTTAKFPGKKFGSSEEQSQSDATKVVILNSSEEVFAKLRDKNFTYVSALLSA